MHSPLLRSASLTTGCFVRLSKVLKTSSCCSRRQHSLPQCGAFSSEHENCGNAEGNSSGSGIDKRGHDDGHGRSCQPGWDCWQERFALMPAGFIAYALLSVMFEVSREKGRVKGKPPPSVVWDIYRLFLSCLLTSAPLGFAGGLSLKLFSHDSSLCICFAFLFIQVSAYLNFLRTCQRLSKNMEDLTRDGIVNQKDYELFRKMVFDIVLQGASSLGFFVTGFDLGTKLG